MIKKTMINTTGSKLFNYLDPTFYPQGPVRSLATFQLLTGTGSRVNFRRIR